MIMCVLCYPVSILVNYYLTVADSCVNCSKITRYLHHIKGFFQYNLTLTRFKLGTV